MPPRSLKRGVKIDKVTNGERLYYQNLEEALWTKTEEMHRGQAIDVFEHGLFYKGYRAQEKDNRTMVQQLTIGLA